MFSIKTQCNFVFLLCLLSIEECALYLYVQRLFACNNIEFSYSSVFEISSHIKCYEMIKNKVLSLFYRKHLFPNLFILTATKPYQMDRSMLPRTGKIVPNIVPVLMNYSTVAENNTLSRNRVALYRYSL